MLEGPWGFRLPETPEWARQAHVAAATPLSEILPLLGWAMGGCASQVWYTYWVLGAGYGMAHGKSPNASLGCVGAFVIRYTGLSSGLSERISELLHAEFWFLHKLSG